MDFPLALGIFGATTLFNIGGAWVMLRNTGKLQEMTAKDLSDHQKANGDQFGKLQEAITRLEEFRDHSTQHRHEIVEEMRRGFNRLEAKIDFLSERRRKQ